MSCLSDARVLITGGTGSFGSTFVKKTLHKYPDIKRLVIYSRDELKQWEMRNKFPADKYPQLRFFLGDIRDKSRLSSALEQINVVVHAAALKQVPAAEYNPIEFIKTNVIGSENLVQACMDNSVEKLIALSTDKAAAPINLYGATKLCSDKLFIAANNVKGFQGTVFSVLRYGNVLGSRGSIVDLLRKNLFKNTFNITDSEMTRFNISLNDSVDHVLWSLKNSPGGDILVPKLKSYKVVDLIKSFNPNLKLKTIGIRPGEKIHEEMITESDSLNTIELKKYFIILPNTFSENKIYKKREFYYHKIPEMKPFKNYKEIKEYRDSICGGKIKPYSHQSFLANFISPNTPYTGLLLFHGVGTGKTASAINIAENFKNMINANKGNLDFSAITKFNM